MANKLVCLGRFWGTLAITSISVVMSSLITYAILYITKSGDMRIGILISIAAPLIISPPLLWYILGLLIKIHELEKEQRMLASIDYLTGVMTRRSFTDKSEALINHCKRTNSDFSVAIIDIDNFKKINDIYGHSTGDEVLKSFGDLIKKHLRINDIVGRIGGEEFAVFMMENNPNEAVVPLEMIRAITEEQTSKYNNNEISYTVCIGVSGGNARICGDLSTVMMQADDALYKAKNNGKNRIEIYSANKADSADPKS